MASTSTVNVGEEGLAIFAFPHARSARQGTSLESQRKSIKKAAFMPLPDLKETFQISLVCLISEKSIPQNGFVTKALDLAKCC